MHLFVNLAQFSFSKAYFLTNWYLVFKMLDSQPDFFGSHNYCSLPAPTFHCCGKLTALITGCYINNHVISNHHDQPANPGMARSSPSLIKSTFEYPYCSPTHSSKISSKPQWCKRIYKFLLIPKGHWDVFHYPNYLYGSVAQHTIGNRWFLPHLSFCVGRISECQWFSHLQCVSESLIPFLNAFFSL